MGTSFQRPAQARWFPQESVPDLATSMQADAMKLERLKTLISIFIALLARHKRKKRMIQVLHRTPKMLPEKFRVLNSEILPK